MCAFHMCLYMCVFVVLFVLVCMTVCLILNLCDFFMCEFQSVCFYGLHMFNSTKVGLCVLVCV